MLRHRGEVAKMPEFHGPTHRNFEWIEARKVFCV
jgi:hypothetical protein